MQNCLGEQALQGSRVRAPKRSPLCEKATELATPEPVKLATTCRYIPLTAVGTIHQARLIGGTAAVGEVALAHVAKRSVASDALSERLHTASGSEGRSAGRQR